ncbi:DUF6789 family protein [Halocatena halophila]|uniref:DUF6789 family protein n=1 Tax=Halocatena halophila TaxID=2814576 RepID=UPI002ED03BC0
MKNFSSSFQARLLRPAIVEAIEMNRPLSAVAGGVAGTAVLSLLMILTEVQTRSQIGTFDVIARFVGLPGKVFVGFALFVVAGVLAWPLLFVALEQSMGDDRDPATRGVFLGLVLWVVFVITGSGNLEFPLLVVFGALTLIAHVAYGFTLGVVYANLRETSE